MELWKTINEYEDYQISNLGNVKMTANNATRKERLLKPVKHPRGYLRVALYKNKKPYFFSVHRLVAINFINNPENKKTVNHINGDKTNNKVENLEWLTYRENMNHAVENRISACGERNGRSKLTRLQVNEIKNNTELNQYELAKKYNVTQGSINRIKLNKGWK